MPQERRKYGKKDYENKKLYNFRSKKLKRKYLQIFHGKKIYIGNYSDRTRADISYNLHLYIEYIEGEKFPKNKLYTRYTQEHGQLKLSKKGK